MTTVYFIRHARSTANLKFACGRIDVPLNPEGRRQCALLAERFADIPLDRIYTSDLTRAVETAQAVNKHHRLELRLRKELEEVDLGDLDGLSREEMFRRFPEQAEKVFSRPWELEAPHGESFRSLQERAVRAVTDIVRECPGLRIAIVSHGDFLRAYLNRAHHLLPEQLNSLPYCGNTSVTRIDYDDELRETVVFYADDSHLQTK